MPVTKTLAACFALLLSACLAPSALWAAPQAAGSGSARDAQSSAYYHYAMAHLYEQLAIEHTRQEYVERAVENYKQAIAADPDSPFLHLELANLYARTNRMNAAVEEAEKVLASDPNHIEARRLLGQIYRMYAADQRNQIDEALLRKSIEQYEKILGVDGSDKDSLLQLANLYRASQQPAKAEEVLKKLLEADPGSADALSTLALLYHDRGDTEGAIDAFEKIRRQGLASRGHLIGLAAEYESAGRNKEAAEILKEVMAMPGASNRERTSLAHNLALAGELDKALEHYEALLQAEPENPDLYLRVSQIHREKGRSEEAWKALRKAEEIAPESIEIKYNVVLLLESENRGAEAIQELQKLLADTEKQNDQYTARDKQNRALFLEQLGMLNRAEEHYAEARQAFQSMAEADPGSRNRALAQIVDTYRAARDYDAARKASQQAHAEFPDSRPIAVQRATVLAETGEASEGVKILRKLLTGEARDREILLTMAQIYEKGKRYDEAIDAIEKADKFSPTEREKLGVLFTYGSVLERAKRFDQAEAKFRELLKLDPENTSALNYLGYMLADLNKSLDEAHDMIQKALDREPDNGAFLDSLGWVYYRQDKLDLAERYLVRSLEKIKTDPIVRSHLGEVYFKQGKFEKAKEQWELALRDWEKSPEAERDASEISKLKKKLAEVNAELSSRAQKSGANN